MTGSGFDLDGAGTVEVTGGSTVRVSSIRLAVLTVAASVAAAGVLVAQPVVPASQVPRGPEADQMRTNISMMESLLERGVGEGIVATRALLPDALSGPMMFSGNNRARGFRIEGYGVFFDVEVPTLPVSMIWSMQVMARSGDQAILRELSELRAIVLKMSDQKERAEILQKISRLQLRVSGEPPEMANRATGTGARTVGATADAGPAEDKDFDQIYVNEVVKALKNTIVGQARIFDIGPDEWLTVAARQSENGPRSFGEPNSGAVYLRVQGRDLLAARSGKMSREEFAKAIKISAF